MVSISRAINFKEVYRKDDIYKPRYVEYLGWNGTSVISGSTTEQLISLSPNIQASKEQRAGSQGSKEHLP